MNRSFFKSLKNNFFRGFFNNFLEPLLLGKKPFPSLNGFRAILDIDFIIWFVNSCIKNRPHLYPCPSLLESTIYNEQATFIKSRQIFYVFLVANEVVDKYKRNNKAVLVFKIDFEKTYDHIDWNFLDFV